MLQWVKIFRHQLDEDLSTSRSCRYVVDRVEENVNNEVYAIDQTHIQMICETNVTENIPEYIFLLISAEVLNGGNSF